MNIDKLIEKWEEKHASILSDYSKGHSNNEVMKMYRSQMKDILDIINDLKQIKTLPSNNCVINNTSNSSQDDFEFNLHKHWKDEPRQDDDYDGGIIKHFRD